MKTQLEQLGYLNFMRSTHVRCYDVNITYLRYLAWKQHRPDARLQLSDNELDVRLTACRDLSCLMAGWSRHPDAGDYIFNRLRLENTTEIAHTTSIMVPNKGRQAELVGYHLNELRKLQPGFAYTIMGWDTSYYTSHRTDSLVPARPRQVDFDLPTTHVLFSEHIGGPKLSDVIQTIPRDQQDLLLLQVALTLRLAQDCFRFMHNRLNASRILLHKYTRPVETVYAWREERPIDPLVTKVALDDLTDTIRYHYNFYTVQCDYVPFIVGLSGCNARLGPDVEVYPGQFSESELPHNFFETNDDFRDLLVSIDRLDIMDSMDDFIIQHLLMRPTKKPQVLSRIVTLPVEVVGNVSVHIEHLDDLMVIAAETGAWTPSPDPWPLLDTPQPVMILPEPVTEIKQLGLFYHVHVNLPQILKDTAIQIRKVISHQSDVTIGQRIADAIWVQHQYKQMLTLGIKPMKMVCDYLMASSQLFRNEIIRGNKSIIKLLVAPEQLKC